MLGWFRRFCLPPPPLVLFRCSSAFAFLFPCLFRVCPFRARCVVLVFSLSLFSCVPLFASWLSIFHFIFIVIFIFISSAPLRWGVCVYHLYRCKTSIYRRGTCIYVISLCRGAHVTCSANEADDMRQGYRSGTPDLRTCYG